MPETEAILQAIYRAADLINAEQPADRQLVKAPETRLLGSHSVLESLQLVALIFAVERELDDAFGFSATLASERALSMKSSPFRSIQSLAEYVGQLMREPPHA